MLNLPEYVYEFASLLPKKSYVVGGFVRDSLLNKNPNDVDICCSIKVENLKLFLINSNFKIVSKTNFQTAKIKYTNLNQNFYFEYSCFRKDFYNHKNGHTPLKIKPVAKLKTDSNRRDFTINCIYFDIKNNKFIDPKKGLKHLKTGVIKTVLRPKKTLKFDGERLLRLIKLKALTNFVIDKKTLKYAIKNKDNLNNLTKKMKQKYIDYFLNLPQKNLKNIKHLLKIFEINLD